MFLPDPFQITDARPDWKGRVKLAAIIILAAVPVASWLCGVG